MTTIPFRTFLALAISAFLCAGARASVLSFEANMDGLQENPPNASPAYGTADMTLDNVSGALAITSASYSGLLGGSIAVGIYDAPPGSNGPLMATLTLDQLGAAAGTISGTGTLTPAQISEVVAGNAYINLRSQVFTSGEIRGQFYSTPEPGSVVLFALGGLCAFGVGWRKRNRSR